MKKVRLKKPGANKGFSLIEVLAAIVLLGLIAAPFLQMVYSSYATNLKSKKYLAAADLCQTVMEGISSQTYEDSTTLGTSATVEGLGKYYSGTSKTGTKKLYPNGVVSGYVPVHVGGDAFSGTDKKIYFRNVSYSGYHFAVVIEITENNYYLGGSPKQKYISVPVKISVYDSDKNPDGFSESTMGSADYPLIQTASTCIPNKR